MPKVGPQATDLKIEEKVEKAEKPEPKLDIDAIHAQLRAEVEKQMTLNKEQALMLEGALQGMDALIARLMEAHRG